MQKRSLALLLLTASLFGPASSSSASYGLIQWSPDGKRAAAYHRERLVIFDVGGGMTVRSDSIPEPAGIALDWEEGRIFVIVEGDPPRVDVYEPRANDPVASLAGCEGPSLRLAWCGGRLVLAGAGFLEVRDIPAGAVEDSLCWAPPMAPVDLHCGEGGSALLFRDRLLFLGGKRSFLSLGVGGEALALLPGERGMKLLVQQNGQVLLASPEQEEARISGLRPGESIVGADCSPDWSRILLVLHVKEGAEGEARSRVEVRDGMTGERLRHFRSARVVRGAGESFELPLGAGFSPGEGPLLIVWPSTGAQLWETEEWNLVANW